MGSHGKRKKKKKENGAGDAVRKDKIKDASIARNLKLVLMTVGSICSGMGTDMFALRAILGGAISFVQHEFYCESNKHALQFLSDNFPHTNHVYDDVMAKAFKRAPRVDLLTAGFPCQPFSAAGLNQGFDDKQGRGLIFGAIYKYIKRSLPATFILENVEGLLKHHPQTLMTILKSLRKIKGASGKKNYCVSWRLLNTRLHGGLPQNRPRLYTVGTEPSFKMKWPREVKMRRLTSVLQTPTHPAAYPTGQHARTNVQAVEHTLCSYEIDPATVPVAIDCFSSRCNYAIGYTPCLTASRGSQRGFWITWKSHGFLSVEEMLKLQGFDPAQVVQTISDNQMGKMIGNAFTQTIMEKLLNVLVPVTARLGNPKLRRALANI